MNKEDLYNPIERLIRYRTALGSQEALSIASLSSLLSIPIDVVRNDINLVILSAYPFILPEDDRVTDIEDDTVLELIEISTDDYAETLSISVDIDEYIAYQNLFEQKQMPKKVSGETSLITKTIRNKKYVYDLPPYVLEVLDLIETAISDRLCIRFDYRNGSKDPVSVIACPARIGFDASETLYVLIAFADRRPFVYDMEKISNIRISSDIPYFINNVYFKNADKVWGFEFDKCIDDNGMTAKPTRVTVRFYNEANVPDKLMRDLTYRHPVKLDRLRSGDIVYTDDVYGIESFKKWIYSYGSSAQILKPVSLRTEFAEDLKRFRDKV